VQPMSSMLVVLIACGSEVGRIPFTDTGTGKTEAMIDAGKEVEFWTHLNLEEEGTDTLAEAILAGRDVSLTYSIMLYQDGEQSHPSPTLPHARFACPVPSLRVGQAKPA